MKNTSVIILLTSLLLSGCQDSNNTERKLAKQTASQVIPTIYDRLENQARQLQASADAFCQTPSQPAFAELQLHWRSLMVAWLETEAIQFGPVEEDNLLWQFQFWPDKKNLVQRKVEERLRNGTHSDISKASVVVQGLSAMEYLLFDASANSARLLIQQPTRCRLLQDIGRHLHSNAAHLQSSWKPGKNTWHERFIALPDQPNEASIPNPISSLMVNSIHTLLERAHKKIVMPLGKREQGKPYLAESWRSRNSLENLAANIQGAKNLYEGANGYGLDDLVKSAPNGSVIAARVDQAFNNVEHSLAQIPQPLSVAVSTPELRPAVKKLADDVKTLGDLFGNDIPNALGIVLGFNANDGD